MQEKLRLLEAMDVYLPDVDGVINCMHNYCLNINDKTVLTVAVPKNRKGYVDIQPYSILRCKSIHVPFLNDYYGFPNSDRAFKKKIREREFDIIHCHSPFNMTNFVLKEAKRRGIPAVATFHSNMRPIFKSILKSKIITEMCMRHLGRKYNKFDECFVCSPLVEEQLRSFGYTGKVTYLPFGTDFKKCECVEENRQKANEIFNIKPDQPVFIYVGRVMKLKRIDFILRSLKIVKDKGVDFKFYIVGKGAESEKLKKLSKKLGFTDEQVIFTGFLPREQFPIIFSRADLLLFPSLYDNFGLVKVEGASYKTPGLFIKNSCAGYGITDGVDGYLSEDDEQSFAEKIIEATNSGRLKEVGEKAMENCYISWAECTDILYDRLVEIVKERKDLNDNKK
ncbi:MAG: glycosyltransferase [Clostridia bacterium]|nr:glycosyltransferase [Clostridia bacterium]